MANKETKTPKIELSEGDIKITGDRLVLGLNVDKEKSKDRSNMSIENPVISLQTDREFREDLISILLTIANLSEKEFSPEEIVKLFKKHKELYKNYKQEGSNKK